MKRKRIHQNIRFEDGFAVGFSMAIPSVFMDALNNRSPNLKAGDIFFDSREPYKQSPWSKCLKYVNRIIQVDDNMTGGRTVRFSVFENTSSGLIRTGTHTLSWWRFLKLLRSGDFSVLN